MHEPGDPNVPATVVAGVVGAILLFVVVVVIQAVFYAAERAENQAKVVAAPSEELASARAAQLETLHSYRWIDEKSGVVGIPVERAMELMVRERPAAARAAAGQGR